jgi:hypothetical protein
MTVGDQATFATLACYRKTEVQLFAGWVNPVTEVKA